MCNIMDSPTQKFGYLDVKQSGKVTGRKLKKWKRRWVVLTKLTDMSSKQVVAKIDLYDSETNWKSKKGDKTTFVLDSVTSINKATSKTHPHAFEVTQRQPELVFSGVTEIDSYSWILTLRQIFTPHLVQAKKDSYQVVIRQNADASRWNLSGQYRLVISSSGISLNDLDTGRCCITWGLSTLMRFNLDKEEIQGEGNVLSIECGRTGPTGESTFEFISHEASDILQTIRQSICHALAQKQNNRRMNIHQPQIRNRAPSESNSEKLFQNILDVSPFYGEVLYRDRSESESSGCTLTPTSPTYPSSVVKDVVSVSYPDSKGPIFPSRKSNSELASLAETEEQGWEKHSDESHESFGQFVDKSQQMATHHYRQSSLPIRIPKVDDPGYSVIKDVEKSQIDTRVRSNTITIDGRMPDSVNADSVRIPPPRRKRVESLNVCSRRTVSFEKDDGEDHSDIDSAISSLNLSSSFDSAKMKGEHFMRQRIWNADESNKDFNDAGPLSRRRSSSTPDLAAYWKHQAGLENVYEELDSARAAASKTSPTSYSDIPPALPARPFSLVRTTRFANPQKITRFKKTFFSNKTKLQRGKSLLSLDRRQGCSCNYPYVSSKGILLSKGNDSVCGQCGGSIDVKQYGSNSKLETSSGGSSTNSSINDIYSKISDVKDAKRRRSSDIAVPCSFNFAERENLLTKDAPRFYSLRRNSSLNCSDKLNDVETLGFVENVDTLKQQSACRLSGGSRNDPLISFFTDDEKFQLNPMVTGELSQAQNRRESNSSVLLMFPDTPKEISSSFFADEIIFYGKKSCPEDENNVLSAQTPHISPSLNAEIEPIFQLDPFIPESIINVSPFSGTHRSISSPGPNPNLNQDFTPEHHLNHDFSATNQTLNLNTSLNHFNNTTSEITLDPHLQNTPYFDTNINHVLTPTEHGQLQTHSVPDFLSMPFSSTPPARNDSALYLSMNTNVSLHKNDNSCSGNSNISGGLSQDNKNKVQPIQKNDNNNVTIAKQNPSCVFHHADWHTHKDKHTRLNGTTSALEPSICEDVYVAPGNTSALLHMQQQQQQQLQHQHFFHWPHHLQQQQQQQQQQQKSNAIQRPELVEFQTKS